MKIKFYTPSHGIDDQTFGAATFGFVGNEDERMCGSVEFSEEIRGTLICGSYKECLDRISDKTWQIGIVLLGNAGGENDFVHALREKVGVPLVGGGAAIDPVTGKSGLITGGDQAAVFLIDDERYDFEVCCENIHHDILSEHEITYTNARVIDCIDGQPAGQWLCAKKREIGIPEADFEHLTLADRNGINAHLSEKNGRICSGRDLQPHMYLRYVPEEKVQERIQAFYNDKNAIVFGCAGLKGILEEELKAEGIGLFLFGEVCTKGEVSEFGNLMLSKIRILKKSGVCV